MHHPLFWLKGQGKPKVTEKVDHCSVPIRYLIIWPAPPAGKINQILRCDWLASGQDGAILPARDYPPRPTRQISQKALL